MQNSSNDDLIIDDVFGKEDESFQSMDTVDLGVLDISEDDPVRQYLKEIGQVSLLSMEQEMWLSAVIASERLLEDIIDHLSSTEKQMESVGLPSLLQSWMRCMSMCMIIGS